MNKCHEWRHLWLKEFLFSRIRNNTKVELMISEKLMGVELSETMLILHKVFLSLVFGVFFSFWDKDGALLTSQVYSPKWKVLLAVFLGRQMGASGTWAYILVSTSKAWVTKEMTSIMDIYSFQCVPLTWFNELFLDQITNWLQGIPGWHSSTYWGSKSLLKVWVWSRRSIANTDVF